MAATIGPPQAQGAAGTMDRRGPEARGLGRDDDPAVFRAFDAPRHSRAWPAFRALGEKTFGMVVIARFPRLDPTVTAACPALPVVSGAVATTAALPPADITASGTPTVSVVAAVRGRSRAPRARFPAVSTLVLAVIAGMFWVAVWREEQRRAAEDGKRDREAMAMEPDGEAGLIR